MKRLLALILAALCLCGCGKQELSPPEVSTSTPAAVEKEEDIPPVEVIEPDPIESLLEEMTLEEKVGQLFFARCPAENAAEDVSTYHLGGYILFGRDTKEKTAGQLIENIASY